jgi:hypothetical protein
LIPLKQRFDDDFIALDNIETSSKKEVYGIRIETELETNLFLYREPYKLPKEIASELW